MLVPTGSCKSSAAMLSLMNELGVTIETACASAVWDGKTVDTQVSRTGSIELYDQTTLRVQYGAAIQRSPGFAECVHYAHGHNKDRTPFHLINVAIVKDDASV
jgi:hypothetical protein